MKKSEGIKLSISDSNIALGQLAGESAAQKIKSAIKKNGQANIVMATGTAQYETLKVLINDKSIDWAKVVMFHLDEYIGIPATHKASFRKFLTERFLDHVPALRKANLINGSDNVEAELNYLNAEITQYPIDVALIGIGENGHVAFNDPPADFDIEDPFITVELDQACRQQQVSEGWFDSIDLVPTRAISMSVKQMMKAKVIIASVPDDRKATAVYNTLRQAVDPMFPSTILQLHPNCEIYLDKASAKLIG